MGLTDIFNKFRQKPEGLTYTSLLDGTQPLFSQFGDDIYASDVVQQAVATIVNEVKKVRVQHIREEGYNVFPMTGSNIQMVLDYPTPWMTQTEFLERVAWNLLLKFNSFVIPDYDNEGRLTALYPINPKRVEFLSAPNGRIYVKLGFMNGYEYTIPYDKVIHLKYRYSKNEFMGGNALGNPDYKSLLKTLEINNILMEGLPKVIKSGLSISGIVQGTGLLGPEQLQKNLKELTERLANNESGFMTMDSKFTYTPLQRQVQNVDPNTLKFIDEKILRTWGVSLPILTGDYTPEQYEAFYQKAVEPIIISLEQAFTRILFSLRERSFGNKIKFYTKELSFMTMAQKMEFVKEVGGRGALTNGYILSIFGIPPDIAGELANKRFMSLNYIDTDIANQYQLSKTGQKDEGAKPGGENDGKTNQ
jgi:HK97 family phage portal protein